MLEVDSDEGDEDLANLPPCADGADNDNDGAIDFGDDPDCWFAEENLKPTVLNGEPSASGCSGRF